MLAIVPFWVIYLFADIWGPVAFSFLRKRKKIAEINLRIAFPEADARTRKRILRQFYVEKIEMIGESLKSRYMSPKMFRRQVTLHEDDDAKAYFECLHNKQTTLILGGHISNWEWQFFFLCISSPIRAVAESKHITPPWGDILWRTRRRFGVTQATPQHLRDAVKNNTPYLYCMVRDQYVSPKKKRCLVPFFGMESTFSYDIERMPRLLHAPVFFAHIARQKKRGHYKMHIKKLATPPYPPLQADTPTITPVYVQALEKAIRAAPSGWLMWHRLWKQTKNNPQGVYGPLSEKETLKRTQ